MECEKVAQLHSNNLIVLASSNCFEFITAFILNYDRTNSTKKEKKKKKKTVQATNAFQVDRFMLPKSSIFQTHVS